MSVKRLVSWDWSVFKFLDTNVVFQTAIFLVLVVWNNKRSSGIDGKASDCLSRICSYCCYLELTFSILTVLWIVRTCDCSFFADFLMVWALLVKYYQIKLLKKVLYILLVLCTRYNSVSVQCEAHQDNWKY